MQMQMPMPMQIGITLSDTDLHKISSAVRTSLQSELLDEMKKLLIDTSKTIVDDLKTEINSLKQENQTLKAENDSLRVKVDDLEQYSRRNAIRISGISESEEENTDELVKQVTREMGIELANSDIDRSHRTGKPITGRNRQILVRFTNYHIKHKILKSRYVMKTKSSLRHVYVNEDLTKRRQSIYQSARKLYLEGKVSKVWTWDGKIFLTDHSKTKFRIDKLEDLDRFRNPTNTA